MPPVQGNAFISPYFLGIDRVRVEEMEERLKQDVLREAQQVGIWVCACALDVICRARHVYACLAMQGRAEHACMHAGATKLDTAACAHAGSCLHVCACLHVYVCVWLHAWCPYLCPAARHASLMGGGAGEWGLLWPQCLASMAIYARYQPPAQSGCISICRTVCGTAGHCSRRTLSALELSM